jgi:DNA-binding PucR family transcriptional regulator
MALDGVSVALGEPADGPAGFRVTHRQAQAALRVALHDGRQVTRYADVALIAFALADETLARSLIGIYLHPLDDDGRSAEVLRETLRAYLAAGRNAQSAGSALGVHRNTVSQRLRVIEDRLGCSLSERHAEVDVALRLERLLAARPAG